MPQAGVHECPFDSELDPEQARNKKLVKIPGEYELDRLADRRPEMYSRVVEPFSRGARP
jgi:hypothetical protein